MEYRFSKSRYCRAVQCPKMIWMDRNMPEQGTDTASPAVLENGNAVGDLAMGLFGPYTEVPYSENAADMLRETERLMAAGTSVITEASFSYDGCFCSVDILRRTGESRVELYEVKSSTEIRDIYKQDVAYQYYVLTALGLQVEKACLVHLNSGYVRRGDIDLQQLFTVVDLTETACEKRAEVEENLKAFRACMQQEAEPERAIGEYCEKPYACPYWSYCTRFLPSPNIFDVAGIQGPTKWKNYRAGIISFEDILEKKAVNKKALLQVETRLKSLPDTINATAISDFLSTLSYPMYFLDFETFDPAVPLFNESHPYEQIVFQYSLHYIEKEGGELKHRDFLAHAGHDPRREAAERLCADIPENVCVLAYNMTFEKTRLKNLAALFPDLSEHLMNIHDRIADLMVPFREKNWYSDAMRGSYSIKYVLPALFPNDPSLNYHNLEGVQNGAQAMSTYLSMWSMTPEEAEPYRAQLLKYCGLDTFAMVKLWEKLNRAVGISVPEYRNE